jgi:hypothetical protein
LRALTNVKAIMVDRWPEIAQTNIPAVLDYPIRSLVLSWYVSPFPLAAALLLSSFSVLTRPRREFVSGLVSFLYADGWRRRAAGLGRLVRATRK